MEAASTASTVSSSGISDGDIALIGHPDDLDYVCAIERNLKLMGYSVVQFEIAGREIISNLMSGVHHALLSSILVLTDNTCKQFHKFCEPLYQSKLLLKDLYLLIYESDKSKPSSSEFRGGFHIKAGCSAEETAERIAQFTEALKEIGISDIESLNTQRERRAFCANLLISSIVNPKEDSQLARKCLDDTKSQYEARFGSFDALNLGDFSSFVDSSDYIHIVDNTMIKIKREGALIHPSWMTRVRDALRHRSEIATTQRQNETWIKDKLPSSASTNKDSMFSILKMFDKVDGSQAYFLVTTSVPNNKLGGISAIPWIQVFDLDCQDEDECLFDSLDFRQKEVSRRNVDDYVDDLEADKTNWLAITNKCVTDYSDWEDKYDTALETVVTKAAQYCCPDKTACFVLLWYKTDSISCYILDRLLQLIRKQFTIGNIKTFPVKLIFCVPETPKSDSHLFTTLSKYKLDSTCVQISPYEVSLCFEKVGPTMLNTGLYGVVTVPGKTSNDELKKIKIKTKEFPSYMDILSTEINITEEVSDERLRKTKEESFHKGGVATWDHIARGNVAIKRDIENEACEKIKQEINQEWKPKILRLIHTPGSGGSTLARQILWSLRQVIPCIEVKPPYPTTADLVKNLKILYEKTRLPLLILLDGVDKKNIVDQAKQHIELVVLLVERKSDLIENRSDLKSDSLSLSESTSSDEASRLITILNNFVSNGSCKMAELQLRADQKYDAPQMFEFGLYAFNEEYTGIRSYVTGFFCKKAELSKWQRILVYLSLLDYYGQTGISRNAFRAFLHPNSMKFVKMTDLPYRAYQFFIENEHEWTISYPMVAREILQLALSPSSEYDQRVAEPFYAPLLPSVRQSLHTHVIDLIEIFKQICGRNQPWSGIGHSIYLLLIRRESTPDDKAKVNFAPLINDIPENDNKIKVMVALVDAFPDNSDYNGHAGRVCTAFGDFQRAETYLLKALDLEKHNPTLQKSCQFHNMFANCCSRHASQLLNGGNENIESALDQAELSISHFHKSRQMAIDNFSFGYMGEIKLRLRFAEYVDKRHGGCSNVEKLNETYPRLAEFIRNSNFICGDLLEECKLKSRKQELAKSKYQEALISYKLYFKDDRVQLFEIENIHRNIPLVRNQLRNTRRAIEGNETVGYIDKNQSRRDVVTMYENLLSTIYSHPIDVSVNLDMYNWLQYIRHPALSEKCYNLQEVVFRFVTDWRSRNERGYADLYLYAIKFAIVVSSDKPNNDDIELIETLRQKMRSQTFVKGRRLEFLTNEKSNTIKKFIQRQQLGEWNETQKTWANTQAVQQLQVCTGTVKKANHPIFGLILLDLKFQQKLYIYFTPKRYQMQGKSGCRVEFHVAFDTFNAAEAHCVRLIEKVECPSCNRKSERLTLNQQNISFKCQYCAYVIS